MWRHVFGKNTRDFAFARLDGKNAIHRIAEDDWSLDACPHRGGALAVDSRGEVHAVWFTQGKKRQGLFYRRLDANGTPRSEPIRRAATALTRTAVSWIAGTMVSRRAPRLPF